MGPRILYSREGGNFIIFPLYLHFSAFTHCFVFQAPPWWYGVGEETLSLKSHWLIGAVVVWGQCPMVGADTQLLAFLAWGILWVLQRTSENYPGCHSLTWAMARPAGFVWHLSELLCLVAAFPQPLAWLALSPSSKPCGGSGLPALVVSTPASLSLCVQPVGLLPANLLPLNF